ncbi:MAG: glyoxylate/hydroxypyruvate reductase A [Saprospiraceae bacterium]|jgi:glyoxylate/hydroxypyruvate reductase A
MKEVLLIKSDFDRFGIWEEAFSDFDVALRRWEEPGKLDEIDYALVWQPEPHGMDNMPKLKVVFSIGAGVDHLKPVGCVPEGLPVVRMVESELTAGMVEFVVFHTLRFHRFMDVYERNQRDGVWDEILQVPASERRVGILGLGELGSSAAMALRPFGFQVQGWSRTGKNLEGVQSFHGEGQLEAFLNSTDILVCLLPLTPTTTDIVNAETLAMLPKGAYFINGGRGGQVDEEALYSAIESEHLVGAALDVFKTEPLPLSSPFWSHPNIYMTPHVASMTTPKSSSRHIINNITRLRAGKPLTHVADLRRGY